MLGDYFNKYPVEEKLNSKRHDKQLEIKYQEQFPYLREDIKESLFNYNRNPLQDALHSEDPYHSMIAMYRLMAPETYENLKIGKVHSKQSLDNTSKEKQCDEKKCDKNKCTTIGCTGCKFCNVKLKPMPNKTQARVADVVNS